MHFSHVIMLVAVVMLIGCSGSSVVVIANRSNVTVSNVVLSGSGFTNRLGNILPGGEEQIRVNPRGESGLRVVFDAAGRTVDSGEQGYFEATGYRVSAVISTNLNVSVLSDLGH
jgi:uncharacterized lipoprotein YajG